MGGLETRPYDPPQDNNLHIFESSARRKTPHGRGRIAYRCELALAAAGTGYWQRRLRHYISIAYNQESQDMAHPLLNQALSEISNLG